MIDKTVTTETQPVKPAVKTTCARLRWLFWGLALGGTGLDLWTKQAAFSSLRETGRLEVVPGFLALQTALNDGAAFSLASGQQAILCAVSLAALVVVLGLFHFGGPHGRLMTVSLGLFAGGIAGNLWDRLFNHGLVRDFIDVYVGSHHWPTFNAADSLLCIAVGLLAISFLTSKPDPGRGRPRR